MDVYEPREDSYLIQKYVEKFVKKGDLVLDMGTGSGILAMTAAKKAKHALGVDINPDAVREARLSASIDKIRNTEFIESDLFERVERKKFNLIIFNPPYLPEEGIDDPALFSGKRGCDTTVRFLETAPDYLADEGIMLLTSSSLADQKKIQRVIEERLLVCEKLENMHVFFEDIFVMKLTKSDSLREFNSMAISGIHFFAKGKRGVILRGEYGKRPVCIKTKRPDSEAMGNIQNEIKFLELLNEYNIGPELVLHNKEYFVYWFVEGPFIEEYMAISKRQDIIDVLNSVLQQCAKLDSLGINKFEMHHPVKHIVVTKKGPVLLDFERARHTVRPKNVTQFYDYLGSHRVNEILAKKGITIDGISMAENYAKTNKLSLIE